MFFTYLKKYLDRLLANKFTLIGLTFLLITSITKPAESQPAESQEMARYVAAHADRDTIHALLIHNSMNIARIQSGRVEKVKSIIKNRTRNVPAVDVLQISDFKHIDAIKKMLTLNSAFSPTSKSTVTLSQVNQHAVQNAKRRQGVHGCYTNQ